VFDETTLSIYVFVALALGIVSSLEDTLVRFVSMTQDAKSATTMFVALDPQISLHAVQSHI